MLPPSERSTYQIHIPWRSNGVSPAAPAAPVRLHRRRRLRRRRRFQRWLRTTAASAKTRRSPGRQGASLAPGCVSPSHRSSTRYRGRRCGREVIGAPEASMGSPLQAAPGSRHTHFSQDPLHRRRWPSPSAAWVPGPHRPATRRAHGEDRLRAQPPAGAALPIRPAPDPHPAHRTSRALGSLEPQPDQARRLPLPLPLLQPQGRPASAGSASAGRRRTAGSAWSWSTRRAGRPGRAASARR